MRKLGLRAVAGSLAALLTVTTVAPAPMALASEMMTAVMAPVSTLVITADMVDDDGEIVISGETWDRIIVQKDAEAADIYFDETRIGNLVVESGNDANIQIWKADIQTVTVKEPELKKISTEDLLALLANKETQQGVIELYRKQEAENAKAANRVPTIVTMDEAKIGSVEAAASAKFDFANGSVGDVTLVANNRVNSQQTVTLKNYEGSVSYQGNDSFSSIRLKAVDSYIENLSVGASSAKNYLTVEAKDSEFDHVAIAGNVQMMLNAPAGTVEVAKDATAAKISLHSTVDSLKVEADNAQFDISNGGSVTVATVEANNVKIEGNGRLSKAVLNGKGAYVSTARTKVDGENTYVEPVYKAPEIPKTELSELPENSKVFLPKETGMGGYGHSKEVKEDGSVAVSFEGQYQEIQLNLPSEVSLAVYEKLVISMATQDTSDSSAVVLKLVAAGAAADEYGNPTPFKEVYGVVQCPGGDITVDLSEFGDKKLTRVTVMANNGACKAEIYRIALIPKEGADIQEEDNTPAAPAVLPENYKVIKFSEMTGAPEGDWGNTREPAGFHDGVKITYAQQYAASKLTLPEAVEAGKFEKMIVTMSSAVNGIMFVLFDEDNTELAVWYGKRATSTSDIEVDLTKPDDFYLGARTIPADAKIKYIALSSNDEGETSAVAYRVAFAPKAEEESGNEKITEFYLFENVSFDTTLGDGGSAALLENCYMDGWNFRNRLPEALKADEAFAEKFMTLAGITEVAEAIEFEVTYEEATAPDADSAGWNPQVEVVVQGNGEDGSYTNNTYKNKWVGIGEPVNGEARTRKTTFYFGNQTFDDASAQAVTWVDAAIGQIKLTAVSGAPNTAIKGSYSVKVILKSAE